MFSCSRVCLQQSFTPLIHNHQARDMLYSSQIYTTNKYTIKIISQYHTHQQCFKKKKIKQNKKTYYYLKVQEKWGLLWCKNL